MTGAKPGVRVHDGPAEAGHYVRTVTLVGAGFSRPAGEVR